MPGIAGQRSHRRLSQFQLSHSGWGLLQNTYENIHTCTAALNRARIRHGYKAEQSIEHSPAPQNVFHPIEQRVAIAPAGTTSSLSGNFPASRSRRFSKYHKGWNPQS